MAGIPGAQACLWVSGVLPSIMIPGLLGDYWEHRSLWPLSCHSV